MLFSGHDLAVTTMNSQQLSLLAQDLYRINSAKTLPIDGVGDLQAAALSEELLAVNSC